MFSYVSKPECWYCGGLVTRRFWIFSRYDCARCGWRGFRPSWNGRVIYLDPKKKYECPECHNVVKPKLEVYGSEGEGLFNKVFKEQCCPRCHRTLPHDLQTLQEKFLAHQRDERFEAEDTATPKCFVSYSWDTPAHKAWVLNLATRLRQKGVNVVLDEWDLQYGDDLLHFMETSVRESDFVILVCTPKYAQKADAGTGGTGYEKRIVTGEMFHSQKPSKFVPLVRQGSNANALPTFLRSSYFIDFRKDSDFEERLMDLLHQVHGVPKSPRPELGQSPFDETRQNPPTHAQVQSIRNLPPPLDMALQMPSASNEPTPRRVEVSPKEQHEFRVELADRVYTPLLKEISQWKEPRGGSFGEWTRLLREERLWTKKVPTPVVDLLTEAGTLFESKAKLWSVLRGLTDEAINTYAPTILGRSNVENVTNFEFRLIAEPGGTQTLYIEWIWESEENLSNYIMDLIESSYRPGTQWRLETWATTLPSGVVKLIGNSDQTRQLINKVLSYLMHQELAREFLRTGQRIRDHADKLVALIDEELGKD